MRQKIWESKYQFNGETYEEYLDRVSGGDEPLRKLISEDKFLFGGRILSNRGTDKGGLFNCYSSGYIEDDFEDILGTLPRIGMTFKMQGGQGVSLSKIRPKGSQIGQHYKSDGIVPIMEMLNTVTGSTSQGGSRKGALLISLDAMHKEAETFITVKSEQGKIENANLSLEISDEFMDSMSKKTTIDVEKDYSGHTVSYTIKPQEVFTSMAKNAWDWGEPGVLFTNRFRNYNMMEFIPEYDIVTGNPCVSGDTEILTEKGYIRIDSLVGQETNIWNGYEFSKVVPQITGKNQKMQKITFSDGSELDCTLYHGFVLKGDSKVEAKDLKVGDSLVKYKFPIIEAGETITRERAYTQGFFMGDGSTDAERGRKSIYLYGKKKRLLEKLEHEKIYHSGRQERIILTLGKQSEFYNKSFVPDLSYSIKSRLDWLAGYLDSDGTNNSPEGSLTISSIDKDVLMQVKKMLNTMGCNAWVGLMKKAERKLMPMNDGKGGVKYYDTQDCYRIVINSTTVRILMELGLETNRIKLKPTGTRDATRFTKVVKIETVPDEETVYCFNEPKNHTGVFNGVLTSQCGEVPLPKDGACLLGSINLSEFVVNKQFDWIAFQDAVKIGIEALDKIIDENKDGHALQSQKEFSLRWRNVGLGVMGFANALMKMEITYGSLKSIEITKRIFKEMFRVAVYASAELGKTLGNFPGYSPKVWDSEIISKTFTPEEVEHLKQGNCLRNATLLSIAPTGSISTMLGISGGIEPEYAIKYNRRTIAIGDGEETTTIYCKTAQEFIERTGRSELPAWFVSSQDINHLDRIRVQASAQDYIDNAISSTVNLPNSATVEDVEEIFSYAHEMGLKGITVFRDGCKRIGILTTKAPTILNTIEPIKRSTMKDLEGKTYRKKVACGTIYLTLNKTEDGDLVECFLNTSKTGMCPSIMNSLNRMISLSLRSGVKVSEIVDQLKGITCNSSGKSCPDAIAEAIIDFTGLSTVKPIKMIQMAVIPQTPCPDCGNDMANMEGCNICQHCGFSRCG